MIRTPKFELQTEKKDGRLLCQGVNTIKEARKEMLWYLNNWPDRISGVFYLWANSGAGKKYFENMAADYYKYWWEGEQLKRELCGVEIEYPKEVTK